MATFELTKDNLQKSIQDNPILLVDFWASWCGPCKAFAPVFEKASEQHPDIAFAKCDTDKEKEVAGLFGVKSIPTLAAFRDEALLYIQAGALSQAALTELIQKIRALDMNAVRAEMAQQEKQEGQAPPEGGRAPGTSRPPPATRPPDPGRGAPRQPQRPAALPPGANKIISGRSGPDGAAISDLADDPYLRRQAVDREFLDKIHKGVLPPGAEAARRVVEVYDRLRTLIREHGVGAGKPLAREEFAKVKDDLGREVMALSSELRPDARGVLRAAEELLKD